MSMILPSRNPARLGALAMAAFSASYVDARDLRTKAKLLAATEEHMAVIARQPERVKAYFQDAYVRYAA